MVSVENLKPKISYIFKKASFLFIICNKCENEDEKLFKEGKSIEILRTLSLIKSI